MEFLTDTNLVTPIVVFVLLLVILLVLGAVHKRTENKYFKIIDDFSRYLRVPLRILLVISAFYIIFESLKYKLEWTSDLEHIYAIISIAILGWLGVRAITLLSILLLNHYDLDQKDNYHSRKIHTFIRIFKSITSAVIIFIVLLTIGLTFECVRAQGASLLASAGILSIVLGLAAQKTIGNLFTGIQIAVAQPIRVDDVVVVENEWGRIEEINLTYVVLKLWDLRRLILPISYFTERPFQNWTRHTADMLGAVTIYLDYTMPIQPVRDELDRLLNGNPLWDKKVKVVQVTDVKDRTIEVRILVSAVDSGASFDLRCAIREGLITFIQKHYPQHLPRQRNEVVPEAEPHHHSAPDHTDPVRAPAPTRPRGHGKKHH